MNRLKKFMASNASYTFYGAYALITACAIFFASYTRGLARLIMQINLYLNQGLDLVFSASALGVNLRQITVLALTPILIVAIPTGLYYLIKRKMPPYLVQIVWAFWIIAALSRLLSQ